jgi:hypothetical protein
MNFLDEVRKKRSPLAAVLKDEEIGIRGIVEELYPDNAHFIYELLQNAEDAKASHAKFILSNDQLIFEPMAVHLTRTIYGLLLILVKVPKLKTRIKLVGLVLALKQYLPIQKLLIFIRQLFALKFQTLYYHQALPQKMA